MNDRYVETNGIRLHVLDHAGRGPVVVLAPGLTANAHSFDGLMRAGLADAAHVIALDLRGRGESDQPCRDTRWRIMPATSSGSSIRSASSGSSWAATRSAGC